jgi:hypothetical protein
MHWSAGRCVSSSTRQINFGQNTERDLLGIGHRLFSRSLLSRCRGCLSLQSESHCRRASRLPRENRRSLSVGLAVLPIRQLFNRFRNNVRAVIIDNTNIRIDECKIYFQKAANHGYLVLLAEPRTSWKRDVDVLAGL